MLGFGALRQGRAYSRDFGFDDLRHSVASVDIRHVVKRGNYLADIYLLAIPRYFRYLVISSFTNVIELLLLLILITLRFLYLYTIGPPWYILLIVLITLPFKGKDLELS